MWKICWFSDFKENKYRGTEINNKKTKKVLKEEKINKMYNLDALSREDRDAKMVIKTPNKTDFGCGKRPHAPLEVG